MEKYTMTTEEYNALDRVLWKSGLSKHGGLDVVQLDDGSDAFEDLEEGIVMTFKEGLQLVKESWANNICFENGDITEEQYRIVNKLFAKFDIV